MEFTATATFIVIMVIAFIIGSAVGNRQEQQRLREREEDKALLTRLLEKEDKDNA